MSTKRDFSGLKQRRLRAAELFSRGKTPVEAAAALGATRQSGYNWYNAWKKQGSTGLEGAGRAGRKPKLDEAQIAQIEARLRAGPEASGFPDNVWTQARVRRVIKEITGVHYHVNHVWRVLRSLGWSVQKPEKRARERNEEAITQWRKQTWPRVKKTPDVRKP